MEEVVMSSGSSEKGQIQVSRNWYSILAGVFVGLIVGAPLLLLISWVFNTYGLGMFKNDVGSLATVVATVVVVAVGVFAVLLFPFELVFLINFRHRSLFFDCHF